MLSDDSLAPEDHNRFPASLLLLGRCVFKSFLMNNFFSSLDFLFPNAAVLLSGEETKERHFQEDVLTCSVVG